MRAWRVEKHAEPADALRLALTARPEPAAGLVRVRVAAAGLGLPDVLLCRGRYPLTPPLPFTPGQELVGIVTAAPSGASARVGERVMAVSGFFVGHGAFAEEALAVDAFALPAPDWLDDAQAAGFTIPYHTAWVGLVQRAALQAGENLLVLGGAGGTGSAAIQLGRALGARVLATASGAQRLAFCRELGADVALDRRAGDVAQAVLEATDGHGADVIYDPVGGDAFRAGLRCLAHEGRLLAVGFASGAWSDAKTQELASRNCSVLGVMPSGYDRAFRLRAHTALLARLRAGELRVPVAEVAPFEALPQALADLAAGRVAGKRVVIP